jgi:hypothetical protein
MAEQRWRWCSQCDAERPATEFVLVPRGQRPPAAHGPWARCPACGHIAPRWAFKLVAPPAGGEGAGGPLPTEPEAKR